MELTNCLPPTHRDYPATLSYPQARSSRPIPLSTRVTVPERLSLSRVQSVTLSHHFSLLQSPVVLAKLMSDRWRQAATFCEDTPLSHMELHKPQYKCSLLMTILWTCFMHCKWTVCIHACSEVNMACYALDWHVCKVHIKSIYYYTTIVLQSVIINIYYWTLMGLKCIVQLSSCCVFLYTAFVL